MNSFLDPQQVPDTSPPGQGEPLNAIISGASDAAVLVNAEVNGGLQNYFLYVQVVLFPQLRCMVQCYQSTWVRQRVFRTT